MSDRTVYRALNATLVQHLSDVDGIVACHGFAREQDGDWVQAARIGQVDVAQVEPALEGFDPNGGGSVMALGVGGDSDWLASYSCGGPKLELCLLFYLSGIAPSNLPALLETIESKTGWILVAALKDKAETEVDVSLSIEIGSSVLLDASQALDRIQLADQWIARLERAVAPDLVAVCWVSNDSSTLAAQSGGGVVERQSRARYALESLANHAIEARGNQLHQSVSTPSLIENVNSGPEDVVSDAMTALEVRQAVVMPLYVGDPCRAVVIALWVDADATTPRAPAIDLIAQVLGESMAIQARARPSILRRLGNWVAGVFRLIFGRRAGKIKLAALVIAVALGVMSVTETQSRPAFEARIEARDRIIISAPFDGFLSAAPFQLGDTVEASAVVVAIDDTDLRLQLARTQAEIGRLDTEITAARSARDTAKVRSLDAQLRQTEVQLDLLSQQMDETKLTVETAGIVVGGDAWRRVGGRVRLGEPLLELADPRSFSVLVFIDESWVANIPETGKGTLLLAAYPDDPLDLTLTLVTTATQNRGGVNTFAAWLRFDTTPTSELLEGMRGIVRIDTGETSMLLWYTRGIRSWVTRSIWRWS
jgi:hypothetical protein